MKYVKYMGRSDAQAFDEADFRKANIEAEGIIFFRGQPVEVTNQMAEALTSNEGIFANDSFEEATEDEYVEWEKMHPLNVEPKGVAGIGTVENDDNPDLTGSTSSETTGQTGAGSSTPGTTGKGSRSRAGSTRSS